MAKVVLLGTAGGPTTPISDERPEPRFGIASALQVDGQVYLVDCGQGVDRQYLRAGLGNFSTLNSIYLTHLHCDHTVDYFNIFLFGAGSGLAQVAQPVRVFGPGDRGALQPFQGEGVEPSPIGGEYPTPGTVAMTDSLLRAFANDLNDRIRNSRKLDVRGILDVNDIELPKLGAFVSANETPHPSMEPFTIHEDARVRVSATLVAHAPVFPAFAFRFDTAYGSVVFSGDTAPSENLVRLAAGADILIHEVIDIDWLKSFIPDGEAETRAAVIKHLTESHTPVTEVGAVAAAANVKTLVLSHLVPAEAPNSHWVDRVKDFSGEVIVGDDLLEIQLPGGSRH